MSVHVKWADGGGKWVQQVKKRKSQSTLEHHLTDTTWDCRPPPLFLKEAEFKKDSKKKKNKRMKKREKRKEALFSFSGQERDTLQTVE